MTPSDVVQWITSASLVAGVIGAGLKYWSDRRKNKAEGSVAEGTATSLIDAARLANLDRHVDLIEKAHDQEREAWREERESYRRRIKALEQKRKEEE